MGKNLVRKVGVIADTHGLLRPEAIAKLAGSDHIIHGGDIGGVEVLQGLRALAPLTVVRGNVDNQNWARSLPDTAAVRIGSARLYVIHNIHELNIEVRDKFAAVISGHSHRPLLSERDGVLFVNPGSAGPRRFSLPVSIACLEIVGEQVRGRIIPLE